MTIDDMLYNLLGLCQKAGKLVSGNDMVEDAIKKKKAKLVIISEDIGNSSLKKLTDKCTFYEVPTISFGTKENLGRSIGKAERTAIAITDKGFAQSFSDKFQKQHTNTPRGE